MSEAHDRQFRDQFSLVIGILAGVVAGILFIAIFLANRSTREDRILEEKEYQRLVAERIAPPARIAVAGQDNSALAITPATSTESAGTTLTIPKSGTEVYQQVCGVCHGPGIGGAPRLGDAAAWAERVAKGKSTLYQHAIGGFQGNTGLMPPKGGRTDIPDDLIQAAVDHMIEAVAESPQSPGG